MKLDLLDQMVQLEILVHEVLLDQEDLQERWVKLDHKDQQDLVEKKVLEENLDPQVLLVNLVQKVKQGHQDHQDLLVQVDLLDLEGSQANQVKLGLPVVLEEEEKQDQ